MLTIQDKHGTDMLAGWWLTKIVASYPFDNSTAIAQRLVPQGRLLESDGLSAWQRMAAAQPDSVFLSSAAVGAILVISAYIGCIRIPGWSINPAVLLFRSSWHCGKLAFSFFVGSLSKASITDVGGAVTVQRVKPVMIELIAGDLLGALVPAVISALFYFFTGDAPLSFNVMP